MVSHESHQRRRVVLVEAHPRGHLFDQSDPRVGVVARHSLADVVQESSDQKEIRAHNPPADGGRLGGGFAEMTVHGEAVIGVALRLVPN